MPSGAAGCANTRRYLPPVRTSISQESRVRPAASGTHQRLNRSGLLQASNTRWTGPSNVRVTTNSRSDLRSTLVGLTAVLFALAICLLLAFQVFDDPVQSVEAGAPELAMLLDPGGLLLEPARPEPAGAHAPVLLRAHQPGLLQHAHVILHPGQGHV